MSSSFLNKSNNISNSNYSYSSIEFTLIKDNKKYIINIPNIKTISAIKEECYNLFYPIRGKFKIFFRNKDLMPFIEVPIYQYFKNLTRANIIVVIENEEQIINEDNNNINNNETELNNNNNDNDNNNNKHYETDINNLKNNKNNINNNNNLNVTMNLPKSNYNDITILNQSSINPINHLNKSMENPNKKNNASRLLCIDCKKNIINYFCRDCNIFLCSNCVEKFDSFHNNHNTLKISYEDIPNSAKKYKKIIEIETNDLEKKFENFETRKKEINLPNIDDFENNQKIKINEYIENGKKIQNENQYEGFGIRDDIDANKTINEIIEKLLKFNVNNKNNNNKEDFEVKSFNQLNEIEKKIKEIKKNINDCVVREKNKRDIVANIRPYMKELDDLIKSLE